jgi:two-component system phosphate regulon sensor histidine kinase PhoR
MKEGLILLASDGTVLSINQSARGIFGAISEKTIGRHILSLCRNEDFQEVIAQGHKGKSEERMMFVNNKTYRLTASPISESGGGMALLVFDVTQQVNAEAGRREFTSNVTHELKTPLTSIVGYAEIMQDGLAKPEDMQAFAGRIYDEAKRLIAMIEDILRLAKLDEEQAAPPTQRIFLKRLCEDVAERLHHAASVARVKLIVEGEETAIDGSPLLLEEMIYNLVDNAIRYNKAEGNVLVSVEKRNDAAVLRVRDTGIGIPKQEQAKVFERFYRVEKSHAKLIEGTGLGLSIVKHIARRHNAAIELDSKEGEGTEIRVIFPVNN